MGGSQKMWIKFINEYDKHNSWNIVQPSYNMHTGGQTKHFNKYKNCTLHNKSMLQFRSTVLFCCIHTEATK